MCALLPVQPINWEAEKLYLDELPAAPEPVASAKKAAAKPEAEIRKLFENCFG